MIPTTSPVVDLFRNYVKLYQMRNSRRGELDEISEKEWKELSFTMDAIFSGLYRPDPEELLRGPEGNGNMREQLPLECLRVPTETDVLCETTNSYFSGRLQDISTGGAYVHANVPLEINSKVRLTFCTFRDEMPLELDGRVAWNNPGGGRKRSYLEGSGVQWMLCDDKTHRKLEDFVYELVEETLVKANLL